MRVDIEDLIVSSEIQEDVHIVFKESERRTVYEYLDYKGFNTYVSGPEIKDLRTTGQFMVKARRTLASYEHKEINPKLLQSILDQLNKE